MEKSGRIELIGGPMFSGKCLGKDTRVLLHNGDVILVQDVKVGDQLMGDDHEPREVLSINHGIGNLYSITQSEGMDYTVNIDHVLSLKNVVTGGVVDISLKRYLNLISDDDDFAFFYRGYKAPKGDHVASEVYSEITIYRSNFDDYYGFTLSGNGRFLLEDYTVTHNTTELLRRLICNSYVNKKILYINHLRDTRSTEPYSTHNPLYKDQLSTLQNVTMRSYETLPELESINEFDTIGIDEAQFFDDIEKVLEYADNGKRVIIAGLSGDAQRKKFGKFIDLIPAAEEYVSMHSLCKRCADNHEMRNADFTFKINSGLNTAQIDVGDGDKYIPVCRKHYLELSA